MRKIAEIIELIKEKKFLRSDAQVTSVLQMKAQALNNHKVRDTIPFDQLIFWCEAENISFDWLVLGRPDYCVDVEKLNHDFEIAYEKMKVLTELARDLPRPERQKQFETNVKKIKDIK